MQRRSRIDAKGDWDSGFSLKRFAERFVGKVENRCEVPIRIARLRTSEDIVVENGQTFVVSDLERVPPRTRVEFVWRPPEGEAPPIGPADAATNSDALDSKKRLGEIPVPRL